MKNKKLLILSVLVAIIWGTIGYKIYLGLGDKEEPYKRTDRKIQSDSTTQEVYMLALNYDDPFLKKKHVESRPLVKKTIQPVQPIKVVPQIMIDWTKVQYFGVIYNASRRMPTAAIKIGSNEYFVKEGGSAEGFVVSEIVNDSVKFSFQNQMKYIKKVKQ